MSAIRSVSVIGVGSMGGPMAENLGRGGFDVSVCDLRDAALDPHRAAGRPTARLAVELPRSDLVIVMVGNDADVATVVTGAGGLAEALQTDTGAIVAIMSSVLPQTILDAARALEGRATVVDAPVSGGPVRAAQATMSIMAGGPDPILDRLQPVFDTLGRPVFRCGPTGRAAGVKIVNNIIGVADMLLMNEAVHLASALGIDLPFLTGVMEVSSGRNALTQDFGAYRDLFLSNAREPDVTSRLLSILKKDSRLARTLAGAEGISAPVLDAVSAAADGITNEDLYARWSEVAAALRAAVD